MADREEARSWASKAFGPEIASKIDDRGLDEMAGVLTKIQLAGDALIGISSAARELELAIAACSMFMSRTAAKRLEPLREHLRRASALADRFRPS